MSDEALRVECRDLIAGLRKRAADCRKMAEERSVESEARGASVPLLMEGTRLREKASAYDHAADLLQDVLARTQDLEVPT